MKLSPSNFLTAATSLSKNKPSRTRLMVRFRYSDGCVMLKCSDERTVLTCAIESSSDLTILEKTVAEVFTRINRNAGKTEGGGGKSAKKGGGSANTSSDQQQNQQGKKAQNQTAATKSGKKGGKRK